MHSWHRGPAGGRGARGAGPGRPACRACHRGSAAAPAFRRSAGGGGSSRAHRRSGSCQPARRAACAMCRTHSINGAGAEMIMPRRGKWMLWGHEACRSMSCAGRAAASNSCSRGLHNEVSAPRADCPGPGIENSRIRIDDPARPHRPLARGPDRPIFRRDARWTGTFVRPLRSIARPKTATAPALRPGHKVERFGAPSRPADRRRNTKVRRVDRGPDGYAVLGNSKNCAVERRRFLAT